MMPNQNIVNDKMYSVYIPKIFKNHGIEKIGSVFFELRVGKVTRVDFVPIEDPNPKFHSAFVYFTKLYNNKPNHILDNIESKGKYLLNLDANIGVSRNTNSEYWILLKNKSPFDETTLNIHQLAHNMAKMEEKMTKMEEENITLRKELERVTNAIYPRINNMSEFADSLYFKLDDTQDKISRLQRTSAKLIEKSFDEHVKTSLINDMVYGMPYSKRLLRNDTDFGDNDSDI
jgi:hypothetical protein